MGLLTKSERDRLVDLLLKIPNKTDPTVRNQLLVGLPRDLQDNIDYLPGPKNHFTSIVNTVDNEAVDEPYENGWPVLQLIDNAIYKVGDGSPVTRQFRFLLTDLKARAEQWRSLSPLSDLPPLDPDEFERNVNERMGFHDPEEWSTHMHQLTLAVCLIEFENAYPKAQGTGFLLGPSVIITNYHVMEQVIKKGVRPEEVMIRFNYKTGSEGAVYRLAPNWPIDSSLESDLDYALVKVAGTPGNDLVESLPGRPQRKWLTPQAYSFQAGEPLFIIQHPKGERIKLAFDIVKTLYPTRVSYRTNTDHGSSGSPCFTVNWELVALHQGTFGKDTDLEKPNKGIPFTPLLQQPKVRGALGT